MKHRAYPEKCECKLDSLVLENRLVIRIHPDEDGSIIERMPSEIVGIPDGSI